MFSFLLILIWIVSIITCCILGTSKGYDGVACFFVGFFLGALGVIIYLCLPKTLAKQEKDLMRKEDMMDRVRYKRQIRGRNL